MLRSQVQCLVAPITASASILERDRPYSAAIGPRGTWLFATIFSLTLAHPATAQPGSDAARPGLVVTNTAITLPDRSSGDSVDIGNAPDGPLAIDMENPVGNRLKFVVEVDSRQKTWTITDGTREIAQLSHEGRNLALSWFPNAPEDAECLRNGLLRVAGKSAAKLVSLRQPEVIEAPIVDLTKSRNNLVPEVRLWGLAYKSLALEAIGLVDNKPNVEAVYPADRRARFRSKVRVVVRDKSPHAGVQLSLLAADDKPLIRVEPLLIDFEDNPQAWTIDGLKRMQASIARAAQQQERSIPAGKRTVAALESQLSALRRQYRSDRLDAPLIARSIAGVESDLVRAKTKLARWEAALPINRERVRALEPLGELSKSVHQNSRVAFRVFYLAGDQEIDLLRAQYAPAKE